jgi:hypothetical protein
VYACAACSVRLCTNQLRDPDDVVGCGAEGEAPADIFQAPDLRLSHAGRRFHPPKPFPDVFTDPLGVCVAGVSVGAPVNGPLAAGILRDVRRHVHLAKLGHKVGSIKALVGCKGDWVRPLGALLDHLQRRQAFGMARDPRQARIDIDPIPVFHQRMPDEAELGLLTRTLAIKRGAGIRGGDVRLVASLLALEVDLGVATSAGRWLFIIVALICTRLEALQARPRFNQRAVGRKMRRLQKPLHARQRQHVDGEFGCKVARQKLVPVLGEDRMIPDRVINPKPHEPAEQKIKLQTLHQLAFGTDGIEGLQQ